MAAQTEARRLPDDERTRRRTMQAPLVGAHWRTRSQAARSIWFDPEPPWRAEPGGTRGGSARFPSLPRQPARHPPPRAHDLATLACRPRANPRRNRGRARKPSGGCFPGAWLDGFPLLNEPVRARAFDRPCAKLPIRAAILHRFTAPGPPITQPAGYFGPASGETQPQADLCNRAGAAIQRAALIFTVCSALSVVFRRSKFLTMAKMAKKKKNFADLSYTVVVYRLGEDLVHLTTLVTATPMAQGQRRLDGTARCGFDLCAGPTAPARAGSKARLIFRPQMHALVENLTTFARGTVPP